MSKLFKSIIISIILLLTTNILLVHAQIEYESNPLFNANLIISDQDFTNYQSMTLEEIQSFLETKGTLGSYIDPMANLRASFIIFTAANDYQINPQVLLTLIQKEQSLVDDPSPSKRQLDWAAGYSCYNGSCDENYRGFTMQIRGAARKFMVGYWPDLVSSNCTFTNWCVNKPKRTQDNILVTPGSKATCALYTYNPYRGNTIVNGLKIGANYNFWKIWNRWFGISKYPDGTLLKAKGQAKVFVIKDGQKRWITSFAALTTRFNPNNIIEVTEEMLSSYPEGPAIRYPLFTLLKTPNGSIYLIDRDSKRIIVSWEVFRLIGFNPEEIEEVDFTDVNDIPDGIPITLTDSYPTGAVLKVQGNNDLYYVENGYRYPIIDEIIRLNQYSYLKPITVTTLEIEKYQLREQIKFSDGTLLKASNDNKVYVISQGTRRLIPTADIFVNYGYSWSNIIEVSQQVLELHPLGESLSNL
ncbi:MAG: hypothetical protein COX77_03970 [Candidatus Komeilibacteria bacterium CG_4_10_14_0_2_um_filter_37_10]|uniref:Uncharacterized protein n=1 Tax=Candidatus Komeilibacteria bacterium CG_4_10_14_0_2_um_filter_37_10 TaxID=1974470 RepID=A0A2M7VDX0_9BACT|nr:MAG: hypothetical protein COX77_03970 [Candidatus Komeilibacteria bacterium CG_4_10_14_0_2_um_filter_37_10]